MIRLNLAKYDPLNGRRTLIDIPVSIRSLFPAPFLPIIAFPIRLRAQLTRGKHIAERRNRLTV